MKDMNKAVNLFADEFADAISVAVNGHPQVKACYARAREAGLEMHVTLQAVVGLVNLTSGEPALTVIVPEHVAPGRKAPVLTASDRRMLRSLRISADEVTTVKANGN